MTTFKVYLTADQWERICKKNADVAKEVARQQPELAKQLGFELKQVEQIQKVGADKIEKTETDAE